MNETGYTNHSIGDLGKATVMKHDRYVLKCGQHRYAYVGPTGLADNIEEAYSVMRGLASNHQVMYIYDQLTGKKMYFKRDGNEIKYPVWEKS